MPNVPSTTLRPCLLPPLLALSLSLCSGCLQNADNPDTRIDSPLINTPVISSDHLQTPEKHADEEPFDLLIVDGLVFADAEHIKTQRLLSRIVEQSAVKIELLGDAPARLSLQAEGKPLVKTLDALFPNNHGIVATYGNHAKLSRVKIILGNGEGAGSSTFTQGKKVTEQQQYLLRQAGKTDDDTLNMMAKVLAKDASSKREERIAALSVLQDNPSPQASELIRQSVFDEDPEVRIAALSALYIQEPEEKSLQIIAHSFYLTQDHREKARIAKLIADSEHPAAINIRTLMAAEDKPEGATAQP